MTTGMLCGKFWPLHRGHMNLIETGLANCDKLYGFVVWEPNEVPDGLTRLRWVKELYPQVQWTDVTNTPGHEFDSAFWADIARHLMINVYKTNDSIDVVFTSEPYGDTWASELGCKHHQHDLDRQIHSVSGTMCREDPWLRWEYLSPPAKQYYAKRVCLVGGESVGKTTMSRQLAEEFETLWVPEVGRFYVEEWGEEDDAIWKAILATQMEFENHLARLCNKVLICDTDLMTTSVWYEAWTDNEDSEICHRLDYKCLKSKWDRYGNLPYDLYIFLTPDVPWVQDGTRTEDDNREWFANRLLENVKYSNVPHIIVQGTDYNERYAQAAQAVAELMV